MRRTAVVMAVAVAVALAGCSAGGAEDDSAEAGGAEVAAVDGRAEPARAAADSDGRDGAADEQGEQDATTGQDGAVVLAADIGDRIVRDGTLRISVEQDGFDAAFDRTVGLADRFGGTVLASDATTDGDGATSGTVTLRVPAEQFDDLLVAVGGIGTVEQRSVTSDDVSDEFVDLQARLRHNRAQERFYLSLLDRADDVDDAIAVQQRVEGIQQTIEQIEGRLRFLDERTSFSRLTVELFEADAAFRADGDAQPSLARYWATARAALTNVLGATLVATTVALPFLVVGAGVALAVRRGRGRVLAERPDGA